VVVVVVVVVLVVVMLAGEMVASTTIMRTIGSMTRMKDILGINTPNRDREAQKTNTGHRRNGRGAELPSLS